ncbi:hypothetical protein ABW14_11950 [Klebsiella michiganensis]|nr:hypothetical protein ABW14_11950 [Klebsiella michiganensis]
MQVFVLIFLTETLHTQQLIQNQHLFYTTVSYKRVEQPDHFQTWYMHHVFLLQKLYEAPGHMLVQGH